MAGGSELHVEAELMKLSHDFAYYMDHAEYEKLIELFVPDAVFDRILHVHRGHDEIRAGLAERSTEIVTRHVTTNFHFTHLSADEVEGVVYNMSYYGAMRAPGELPAPYGGAGMLLEFHDRYVRTTTGWRFARRVARAVLLDEKSPMWGGGSWRPDAMRSANSEVEG